MQSILYSESLVPLLTAECIHSSPFMTILLTGIATGGTCREEQEEGFVASFFVLARTYPESWTCLSEKERKQTTDQIWEESESASRVCCFIVWLKKKP